MNVSVLILTYNEEQNIDDCLKALAWCEEIVVIDSGSSDRTCEIAASHNAVILTNPFQNFATQRNFGLTNHRFKHDWVLHLDADEIIPEKFVTALHGLDPPSTIDAYWIPAKTIFYGKWIKHAGMWPTYQVRLGRKDALRFINVGHGQRETLKPERIGTFEEPYEHHAFSHGLVHWLRKHVRYAEDEAKLLIEYRNTPSLAGTKRSDDIAKRRHLKKISAQIPFFIRPIARFAYIYFARGGFLDGKRGLLYALMLSVYEGMTAILAYERLMAPLEQADVENKSR